MKQVELLELKNALKKAKRDYDNGLRYYDEKHKTYNPASRINNILEHVSDLVGLYGLLAYEPGDDNPTHPTYEYINSGDTYNLTVIYNNNTRRFMFTDIGTIIEQTESLT